MADDTVPASVQGPFCLLAIITAAPGKGDAVEEHLSKMRAHAESDAEADTLTFRPARGYGGNPEKFIIFEKYLSKEAFEVHKASPAVKAFKESNTGTIDKVEFFNEIGAASS